MALEELEFSSCGTFAAAATSTAAATITSEDAYNWSPAIDWDALPTQSDDLQDWDAFIADDDLDALVELMMEDGADAELDLAMIGNGVGSYNSSAQGDGCDSVSASSDAVVMEEEGGESENDSRGLRLVHLLIAAAEALAAGARNGRELARVILVRLREVASPAAGSSNIERLAAYFTDALQSLAERAAGNALHGKTVMGQRHREEPQSPPGETLVAFQLLQDMSPYVKFGHFTANQAILEAVASDKRIHIVDYDIMEGTQWASLMQALVSRQNGAAAPHLRITALWRGGMGRRSMGTVQETGRHLVAFAESIGQSFSFHHCRLDSDETFRPSGLKLVRGEALVMNCMLHLPHSSAHRTRDDSLTSFLSGAGVLNPRIITVVEEEAGLGGDGGFVGNFADLLHHYSALCDSLEAGFPMESRARALVERTLLGPRITRSVARIYCARRDGKRCSWWQRMRAAGFKPVRMSFANHCQAKLLLGLFNDGYRVEEAASNRLVLGWKSRRLLSASVWACAANPVVAMSLGPAGIGK